MEFPASLAEIVADRYGLAGAPDPIVDGGDECLLWRLAAPPVAVVRVSPARRTVAGLAASHRVAAAFGVFVPEVTRPLAAWDGTTVFRWENRPVSVWPLIDGAPLDRENADLRARAAALLARLHLAATRVGDVVAKPVTEDRTAAHPGSRLPDDALDAWCERWLRHIEEPAGFVHGDFYRRNILCRDGRIVGLIDWDDARHDLLVTELAWAMWEFAKSPDGTTLTGERAAQFLNDYRAAGGPVRPSPALIPLIRLQLRYEVDRAERARHRGEPVDETYQQSEIAAFDALRHMPCIV